MERIIIVMLSLLALSACRNFGGGIVINPSPHSDNMPPAHAPAMAVVTGHRVTTIIQILTFIFHLYVTCIFIFQIISGKCRLPCRVVFVSV